MPPLGNHQRRTQHRRSDHLQHRYAEDHRGGRQGLPEDERAKRSANAADFKEAIRLFHLGRRDEARAVLQKIADDGKNDYVSDMYLKYITELSDEDKANVFRFVRK